MGTIVKNWISNKLGLEISQSPDPPTFRSEVANGILIAEILRKYGLLSDDEFISLRHNNVPKSRISNMGHVHKWLTNAGMDLNEDLMMDVAEEKAGSAVKFLYELFLWLEDGPRTPSIGDKAKKYLTERTRVPPKPPVEDKEMHMHRKSRDQRLSVLSSTWMQIHTDHQQEHQEQGEEVKAEHTQQDIEIQERFAHEYKKETLPPSNWLTCLDPQQNFQTGGSSSNQPYNELSESAQAEAVYFAHKTLEIYKDQEKLKNEIRALQRKRLDALLRNETQDILHALSSELTCANPADEISKTKEEKRRLAEKEMKKYNVKVKRNKNKDKTGQDQDIDSSSTRVKKSELIYRNGRGCKEHFQRSLDQLKQRRQKELNARLERNKRRKATMNEIIHEIPNSMFTIMNNEVLKLACTSLPTSEQLLADFIHFGHQEKGIFKQHAYFDTVQRQEARNFDLHKTTMHEEEENNLKREAFQFMTEKPVQVRNERHEEEVRQIKQVEEKVLAHHIVENILDLVFQFGDYQSSLQSDVAEAKLFTETKGERNVNQPKIVLLFEQTFALEIDKNNEYEKKGQQPRIVKI